MQHIASVVNQQVASHATQGHFTDSLKRGGKCYECSLSVHCASRSQ